MSNDTRLEEALLGLRRAVSDRLARMRQPLDAQDAEVTAAVEERKRLATELQLAERFLKIYEEVKCYPHWSLNCPAEVCKLASDVNVSEDSIDRVTVCFAIRDKGYSFKFDGHYSHAPDDDIWPYYATLTLHDSGGSVLFGSRMRKYEFSQYEIYEITAFVPGKWVLDLLDLSEEIAEIDRGREQRRRLSDLERQRRDFGLANPETEVQKLKAALRISDTPVGQQREDGTVLRVFTRWLRRFIHGDRE